MIAYPAPCHSKHSDVNNIGWIKDNEKFDPNFTIGIAHGALEGISLIWKIIIILCLKELEDIPVDVWLLGHTM